MDFFILLTKVLVTIVFVLYITSAESASNTFTEKGISLLGYHLCNYSVIKNVSKTVAYQKSYEKQTPCGWIPWRLCTTTYYKEEYHPIMVQEAVNVTDCCAGYEQVGLYCSLPINRSNEFASRPGACPMKIGEALKSSCVSDMDCPEYKKCCKTSTGVYCSDPVPEERTVTKYWYNVSVLVKTDFSELYKVDPRLLNHSRLLHSMITGALWPMDISVYHIQTTKSETYAETLVSHVLVGLQQLVPLVNISSLLKKIVIRVYEVIDVVVQDCDHDIPNILIKNMHSSNLLRNSRSAPPEIHVSVDSECESPSIRNHKIFGVTSSSFKASWSINSSQNHSFRAEVYKSNELVERMETTDMNLTMLNLEAGVMYTMNISYEACGKNITSSRIVKTDALIFGLTLRILNYNFTNQFLNVSSREYQNFSRTLMGKIRNSYPSNMNALHLSGKLKVQVDSIKAGSIIVKLKIIIQDLNFSKDLSAFDPMIASLYNSSMLGIDPKISAVEDWDECAHRTENDCSMSAECINTVGSYRCRCKTATDANPARPGRNCEGEIVDPVTTQGLNVADYTTTAPFSMAEIEEVSSFTKYTEATVLPSSGIQESSTLPAEKTLSTSQKMNILGNFRNDSIFNSSETVTLAPKWSGNVTNSDGTVAEEKWTTQDLQSSSVTSWKRNESTVETSTPGSSTERSYENVIALNVTENPKFHSLNHTLDRHMGENNSSWSNERNSTASPSSFKENMTVSLATDLSAPFPAERIFFSNVTNTSFQISWITHFPANTTFHFLLFVEEQLIKETKTQSSHLNISDLKAGTLYTVKIKPDLYGNESKTMQRKVKTAAQKFNGVVRIMNLNYSSEFSNSRSEKHQNFSKMFLNEVRTYLPPNILQKMDAGMINISIVSIIPGSIVVNFSLLIPIDMDGRNVAGYLLEAFRNSSLFEVDNSSLSIYVFSSSISSGDEQSKEWSSTALPLTYLYTSDPVPSSAKDNFSISSGRSLENATVNTTNNKKNISQTTNINYLPQNLPSINSSAAGSVKEAVQVLCEFEKIVISIKKDFLYQQSIPETSLYLGHPRCNVSSSNSSHVVLETDWNECETEIQTNITHTVARTILRDDYSSHGIIHDIKISSQIHCIFQNDLLISSGHTSEGVYTIFEDLHGSGHFLTEMRLLIGNSPIPPNFSISGSDNVIIEVGVQTRSKKLKVVVSQCWATPTNNSTDPRSLHFIHGGCPVPNRNTTVIVNGVANRARFKLNIFSFFNGSMVYLHCKVQICIATPKSTCRANCQGFRFWKSGEIIATPKTTWGPLRKFNAELKEEKKTGMGVGYITLIVIAVLVLALGIAGLLVCRHKRKAGMYDLKRRTEFFNYQAFHD
ncbi:uromodulin-like 1 [Pseudonaja textilis]|uniref:uromodulin-like 1 n=1 Tax=Pseudonaja textilis TaxID=8673 RepID=UPI000EAA2EB0|nr:uromodulin-like 1 [Pseudonaja textilis]